MLDVYDLIITKKKRMWPVQKKKKRIGTGLVAYTTDSTISCFGRACLTGPPCLSGRAEAGVVPYLRPRHNQRTVPVIQMTILSRNNQFTLKERDFNNFSLLGLQPAWQTHKISTFYSGTYYLHSQEMCRDLPQSHYLPAWCTKDNHLWSWGTVHCTLWGTIARITWY